MASARGVQECRQGPSPAWRRASRWREGFGMGRAAMWAPYPQKQQQLSLEEEACLRVSGPLLCARTCPDPVWPGGPSLSPGLAPRLAEAQMWAECITRAHREPRLPVAFLLVKNSQLSLAALFVPYLILISSTGCHSAVFKMYLGHDCFSPPPLFQTGPATISTFPCLDYCNSPLNGNESKRNERKGK